VVGQRGTIPSASEGLWRGFAIRDGNLVTGQQKFSGTETAEPVATALGDFVL